MHVCNWVVADTFILNGVRDNATAPLSPVVMNETGIAWSSDKYGDLGARDWFQSVVALHVVGWLTCVLHWGVLRGGTHQEEVQRGVGRR